MPFLFVSMKEIITDKNTAGLRLDKFLLKYLNLAPSSLIHKYLRKKDIRLNGKRAEGNEKLRPGDIVQIRLPDAQIEALTGVKAQMTDYRHVHVVYEDEMVLILNKPAGILTQKAHRTDVSLNEEMISYLMDHDEVTAQSLAFFKPSVCNRLDRNTSGLVMAAKTLPAAQTLSELIRSRRIGKYYQCIVLGTMEAERTAESWLMKDERTNQSEILRHPQEGAAHIITEMVPVKSAGGYTLVEVHLVTGKTHQIRAQLSALGYPIAGDAKYGGAHKGLRHQLLCACRIVFPDDCGTLAQLNGTSFEIPLPGEMTAFARRVGL